MSTCLSTGLRASVAVLMGLALTACQQDTGSQSEAETHWLDQCGADADCGAGICVCGVCTEACDAEGICAEEARPACANVQRLARICGAPVAACVRECAVEADCGAGDFACRDGLCVAADAPVPEPEAQPEPEPQDACAAICDGLSACFADRCPEALPDLVVADCLAGCADAGAVEWGASFETCDRSIRYVRDNYADLADGCDGGPAPIDCESFCAEIERCGPESCPDAMGETLGVVCERSCAASPEVIAGLAPFGRCDDTMAVLFDIAPGMQGRCTACESTCDAASACLAEACDGRSLSAAQTAQCLEVCRERMPVLGDCAASLDFIESQWAQVAEECAFGVNPLCTPDIPRLEFGVPAMFDTAQAPILAGAGCDAGDAPARRFSVVLDQPAVVVVQVDSNFDSVLVVHPGCDTEAQACRDDGAPDSVDARLELALPVGTHEVAVTGFRGATGAGQVVISRSAEPLLPACEAIEQDAGGHWTDVALETAADITALQPQARAAIDAIRVELAGQDVGDLVARAEVLTTRPICDRQCDEVALDVALSDLERLKGALQPLIDASATAADVAACVDVLGRRVAGLQGHFTAAYCGDTHPTAELVQALIDPDSGASINALLCATRNAHDLCQARYLGAAPLSEPGRCPACTVQFGETACAIPPTDPCGAAGECLCAAADIDGEDCEFVAFGPRGAIAFGEACGGSDTIGRAMSVEGFDDRGLAPSASPACDLMPAVLEERQCEPQAECQTCNGYLPVPAQACEPGNNNCEVHIECGQRFVAIEPGCFIVPGLCPDDWDAVDACADGQPCEHQRICGTVVACQPSAP